MKLYTSLENLDNIPDGETRKIIDYKAGSGIDITDGVISAIGGGTGGTMDYNELLNHPKINGVELVGDKSTDELGINLINDNQVLWGPDYYFMSGSNTINLSQKVSEQKTGIVLVWQAYSDNAPQPWDYNFTFIPKWQVSVNSSRGVSCFLTNSSGAKIGTKYVYVHDDKIVGNNVNGNGATKRDSGITTTNNYWVLTHVLGV